MKTELLHIPSRATLTGFLLIATLIVGATAATAA